MKIEHHIVKRPSDDILQKRLKDISLAVNGNIHFGSPTKGTDNMFGFWVNITTPGADVEFTINHNLDIIPTGIIVVSVDKAAVIYSSRKSQWTTTQAFFKCNVTTVALVGFII